MDPNDKLKFGELYLKTAKEYLTKLQKVELTPHLLLNFESLQDLIIAAHSIKGQSRVMEYTTIANAAERIEKIFRLVQENKEELTEDEVTQLHNCLETLQTELVKLEKGETL